MSLYNQRIFWFAVLWSWKHELANSGTGVKLLGVDNIWVTRPAEAFQMAKWPEGLLLGKMKGPDIALWARHREQFACRFPHLTNTLILLELWGLTISYAGLSMQMNPNNQRLFPAPPME